VCDGIELEPDRLGFVGKRCEPSESIADVGRLALCVDHAEPDEDVPVGVVARLGQLDHRVADQVQVFGQRLTGEVDDVGPTAERGVLLVTRRR